MLSLGGNLLWSDKNIPRELVSDIWPISVGLSLTTTPLVRDYKINELGKNTMVQSMGHHGRSCYLGADDDGWHYFSKGVGWCLGSGWAPILGNTGILAKWAAIREKDISLRLIEFGMQISEPMAIWELNSILGPQGSIVDAKTVKDLDGSFAKPSIFVYRSKSRWRLADMMFVSRPEMPSGVEDYWAIVTRLFESVGTLHRQGGHDYSLSLHNIWIDGSRVDFEYVYLDSNPHSVEALNTNLDEWRRKEFFALREICFHLADIMDVTIDAGAIRNLLEGV